MADGKYGMIYTAEDVHAIVEYAIEHDFTGADQLAEFLAEYKGKFPVDEPLFIMRAQDRYAMGTIRQYRELCDAGARRGEVPVAHMDRVDQTAREFAKFASDHGTKNPD